MRPTITRRLLWLALFAIPLSAQPAAARVSRIVFDKAETVVGHAGALERITGRAFGDVDPADAANTVITDLKLASRDANGRVSYIARFTLTKPSDMARASGVLWYDLVNRGASVTPGDGATRPSDFGHVELISGWQGDLVQTASNWAVQVPVAVNADGSPITGPVLARIADVPAGTRSRPLVVLASPIPYDAASLDTKVATLTTRRSETRTGQIGSEAEVASADWAFADC